MITSNIELQSAKRLAAELEAEALELEKLEQTPDVVAAINQRREHAANLKSEIEVCELARDEIDREIIKDLRSAVDSDKEEENGDHQ